MLGVPLGNCSGATVVTQSVASHSFVAPHAPAPQNQQQRPAGPKGAGGEDEEEEEGPGVDVLCERCYSLKHEGWARRERQSPLARAVRRRGSLPATLASHPVAHCLA